MMETRALILKLLGLVTLGSDEALFFPLIIGELAHNILGSFSMSLTGVDSRIKIHLSFCEIDKLKRK